MRRLALLSVPLAISAAIAGSTPAQSTPTQSMPTQSMATQSMSAHHSHGLRWSRDSQATKQKPAGWDEPSGIGGYRGRIYVASQNPEQSGNPGQPDLTLAGSRNGHRWYLRHGYFKYEKTRSEGTLGDVTMTSDQTGTVFVGHLTAAVQADIDWTRNGGKKWHTSNDVGPLPPPGGASSSPSLVDRPWIASYNATHNYKKTDVYLEYHDFSTSDVYIVTCKMATGSLACGAPVPVSNAQTGCNSVPGGVAVSPPGSKHPGRVYAVWTTADPVTNVTSGCNYTQLAPFYSLYVAWSDNPTDPTSWHQKPVYIGPHGASQNCPGTAPVEGVSTNTCADMSEVFTPIAVDQAGNVYVSFVDYISTLHHAYDVYVERSTDGGNEWDGKANGSGKPVLVSSAHGMHFTPNLVAGSKGRVAVIYYATHYTNHPYVKGAHCPQTVPPETSCQGKNKPEPPHTRWVTEVSVSRGATRAHPHFRRYRVSDRHVVVHYGDICNLGIFCDGSSGGNRSLFENNTVFTNRNGCLVAAWTDQRHDKHGRKDAAASDAQSRQEAHDEIFVSRQTRGAPLLKGVGTGRCTR